MKRFYVLEVTTNSTGTETRNFKAYDDYETALRKFFEPFGVIGGGPLKIAVMLLGENLTVLKKEVWAKPEETTEE